VSEILSLLNSKDDGASSVWFDILDSFEMLNTFVSDEIDKADFFRDYVTNTVDSIESNLLGIGLDLRQQFDKSNTFNQSLPELIYGQQANSLADVISNLTDISSGVEELNLSNHDLVRVISENFVNQIEKIANTNTLLEGVSKTFVTATDSIKEIGNTTNNLITKLVNSDEKRRLAEELERSKRLTEVKPPKEPKKDKKRSKGGILDSIMNLFGFGTATKGLGGKGVKGLGGIVGSFFGLFGTLAKGLVGLLRFAGPLAFATSVISGVFNIFKTIGDDEAMAKIAGKDGPLEAFEKATAAIAAGIEGFTFGLLKAEEIFPKIKGAVKYFNDYLFDEDKGILSAPLSLLMDVLEGNINFDNFGEKLIEFWTGFLGNIAMGNFTLLKDIGGKIVEYAVGITKSILSASKSVLMDIGDTFKNLFGFNIFEPAIKKIETGLKLVSDNFEKLPEMVMDGIIGLVKKVGEVVGGLFNIDINGIAGKIFGRVTERASEITDSVASAIDSGKGFLESLLPTKVKQVDEKINDAIKATPSIASKPIAPSEKETVTKLSKQRMMSNNTPQVQQLAPIVNNVANTNVNPTIKENRMATQLQILSI
jgi:uncharacterized protein YoxC